MRSRRLIVFTVCIVALLLGVVQLKQVLVTETTFSKATIKYGAAGNDVIELQGRLKYLGYYKSGITGKFDYATLSSLKKFQSAFGMKADGVAGSQTKLRLWKATQKYKPGIEEAKAKGEPWAWKQPAKKPAAGNTAAKKPAAGNTAAKKPAAGGSSKAKNVGSTNQLGLSANDLKIMANAVYGEARGEPYEGQVAVAAVILNRVKSASFPNTPSGVIFQPRAFTAVDDGQIWLTPNERAKQAVQDALNGWDPTGGCLYYFNPVTATSKWIWTRPQVKTIGKHIFCM